MILLLTILVPAVFGIAMAVLGKEKKWLRNTLLFSGQILAVALYLSVLITKTPSLTLFTLPGGASLRLCPDKPGLLFGGIGGALFFLISIYAPKYMTKEEKVSRFYAFFLLSLAAFYGVCLSGNLLSFYLFFELTTLMTFPLVLHEQTPGALLGGKKYLFYSMGGALLALGGVILLMQDIGYAASFAEISQKSLSSAGYTGIFLAILGFSVKAGMFPFQSWLPSAHPVCPAPASALLSGLIVKAGVLGIIRVSYCSVDVSLLRGTPWQYVLLSLSCFTVVCGSTMAFGENVLKKRLAWSTVSNLSYILSGIFLFTDGGLEGAVLHVMAHAMGKSALFLAAGGIIFCSGKTKVEELSGLGKKMPGLFAGFLLAGLSLVGIPPFGGFLSKWSLCTAALESGAGLFAYLVPVALLLSAFLTAGYLFMPVIKAFYYKEEGECKVEKAPVLLVSIFILAVGGLLLGVFGVPAAEFVRSLL